MVQTRYPIVLVHGMMAKDFRFWRAFRGIKSFLQARGVLVYVTNQDGVGAITTNAAQLREEILAIIEKEGCEKVNLIAHSKGGIDSRYMITHLDMAPYVASLTTLSSPHHGSGLSGRLVKMPRWLAKPIAFFTNLFYRISGDRQPDIFQLGLDLTEQAMEQFNRDTPNAPSVYYQSYSSSIHGRNSITFIPYQVSRFCEQDATDGLVSVSSSKWGIYRGDIGNETDHFKMVGIYGTKQQLEDVSHFYLYVIQELQAMGF